MQNASYFLILGLCTMSFFLKGFCELCSYYLCPIYLLWISYIKILSFSIDFTEYIFFCGVSLISVFEEKKHLKFFKLICHLLFIKIEINICEMAKMEKSISVICG